MRLTTSLLTAALITAGCGNNPLPQPDLGNNDLSVQLDMSGPPADLKAAGDMTMTLVSFSQFQIDQANAICAHEVTCGQLPSDATSLANCYQLHYTPPTFDLDTEIAKGRIEVNEAQCLAAISNSRCDASDIGFLSSRCGNSGSLFVPHQQTGSACLTNAECINGYCAHVTTDAGPQLTGCPGTCTAFKTTGASCAVNVECNVLVASCPLSNHLCTPKSDVGQPCGSGGAVCKFGLFCPSFAQTPTCQGPAMQMMAGGPCDPAQGQFTPTPSCAAGFYCQLQYPDGGGKATGAVCKPKIGAGNPCNPADVGAFSYEDSPCQDGTVCFTTGAPGTETCQALGSAGSTCKADTHCSDTYYCNLGTNKCVSTLSNGAPCPTVAGANQCASTTCGVAPSDLGSPGMCVTQKGFGATCVPGQEDSLCNGIEQCAPIGGGGGVCTPKCL